MNKFLNTTLFGLAVSLSSAALAAGSHAGGHGHDDEAIGKAGQASKVNRTIQIEMSDSMRYTPSKIEVKRGETVRFVVKNTGKLRHELTLGTEKSLKAHAEEMKKFPNMEHDDPETASVEPGKTGEIIWQFTKAGKVAFACLIPGHFEAGMKGQVQVSKSK